MATDYSSAICQQISGDIWFTDEPDTMQQAKALCEGCPLRRECLRDVLTGPRSGFGVFAGTTVEQRDRLRRRVRHGTPLDVVVDSVVATVTKTREKVAA